MKINEMYDDDDLDFDMSIDQDDDEDMSGFKQEAVQSQLMKIADSEPSDEIKNPVRSVVTDDGDTVQVEHGEALAILKLLQMNMKPDMKLKIQRDIQSTKGLNDMIEFVKKHGMIT